MIQKSSTYFNRTVLKFLMPSSSNSRVDMSSGVSVSWIGELGTWTSEVFSPVGCLDEGASGVVTLDCAVSNEDLSDVRLLVVCSLDM